MKEIKLNQNDAEEIQSKINDAKRTLELKEYTAVGVALRQADELFAKMILNLFISENESDKYFNLDKKLAALKDYGCFEKVDCDILYEVKQFGNNSAHSEKTDDFDSSQAYELIPKFEKVLNKYFSCIGKEYQNFLRRRKEAENEIFKKADYHIFKALKLFTECPWKAVKTPIYHPENPRKPMNYYLQVIALGSEMTDDMKIDIKKNLYLATLNYLIALNKLNNCYKNDNDFLTLVKNLEYSNEFTYKNHPELNGCLYFDVEKEMNDIFRYKPCYTITENHSYGIDEHGKVVKLYCTSPISMPSFLINNYLKTKYDEERNNTSVDTVIFTEINKICAGALREEVTWNEDIYGYIRLLHQSVEKTKRKYGKKYQENSLRYLTSVVDVKIKKQVFDAKTALEEQAKEPREQYEKEIKEEKELQIQQEMEAKKQEEASDFLKTFGKLFAIFVVIACIAIAVIRNTNIVETVTDVASNNSVFDNIDYLNIGYDEDTLKNYKMEPIVLKSDSEYAQNRFEYNSETNSVKYVSTGEEISADDLPHSLSSLEQISSETKEKIRTNLENMESTVSEKIMESVEETDTQIESIDYEYYGDALLSNGCYVMTLKGTIKYADKGIVTFNDDIFFVPLCYKATEEKDGTVNIDLDSPVEMQEHTSSFDGLSMVKLPAEAVKRYPWGGSQFSSTDFSTEYYGWSYFVVKSWE